MATASARRVTAISIFHHAETFIAAYDQLHAVTAERVGMLAAPITVISAFASELYLKCLIGRETGDAPRGHDLMVLHSKLTTELKAVLEKHWLAIASDRSGLLDFAERQRGRLLPRNLSDALREGAKHLNNFDISMRVGTRFSSF